MENGYQTVKDVLKESYYIPRFQRGYRWTEDNVEKLIEDIFEGKWLECDKLESADGNLVDRLIYEKLDKVLKFDTEEHTYVAISPYCIQPLAVCKMDGETDEGKYAVIDGQQRLTTIKIILSVMKGLCSDPDKDWQDVKIEYESRGKEYFDSIFNIKADEIDTLDEMSKKCLDYSYMHWACKKAKEIFEKHFKNLSNSEYRDKYLQGYLRQILLYHVRFIWYEFDDKENDPHIIFDNFNSGKTSLTDAELIKAIFMDGENYSDENIDDKRIVISEKWDEIENELWNEDFWAFLPHDNQYGKDNKYYSTRIELIFEYLVCRKWEYIKMEEEPDSYIDAKQNATSDHFLYELVNRWIGKEIEGTDQSERVEIMARCWSEVKNIFLELKELYQEDVITGAGNQIYNMVGLYVKLCNFKEKTASDVGENKNGISDSEKKFQQDKVAFETYKKLYEKVIKQPRRKRIASLKGMIREELGMPATDRNAIEEAIRNANYISGETGPVIKLLLAYNTAILNKSKGFGERFNFRAIANQKWQLEHIFPCQIDGDKIEKKARKEILEKLSKKEDNDYVCYVKELTGWRTHQGTGVPDEKTATYWKYDNGEGETILNEDDEDSVNGFLNYQKKSKPIQFSERDESDSMSEDQRMYKALTMRIEAKEKLDMLETAEQIEKLLDKHEKEKEGIASILADSENYLNSKETCFNGSMLQKNLKEEIEKQLQDGNKEVTYPKERDWKITATTNQTEDTDMALETNWFRQYREKIQELFFVDAEGKKQIKTYEQLESGCGWELVYTTFKAMGESLNNNVDHFFKDSFPKYMKDNSMGNMTLLTGGNKKDTPEEKNQNAAVSASLYSDKKQMVYEFFKEGAYVPLGTVLVFSDVYNTEGKSANFWLHDSRRKYLQDIKDTLVEFLGEE